MTSKSPTREITTGNPKDLRNIRDHVITRDYLPLYYRVVVLDVIYDPLLLDEYALQALGRTLKNDYLLRTMPRNTIIAQKVMSQGGTAYEAEIFLPFFSSHLSLPIKPGEHAWVMYEDHSKPADYGFWMSRIHEPRQVEDVNFCVSNRRFEQPSPPLTPTQIEAGWTQPTQDELYDFPNGKGIHLTLPEYDPSGRPRDANPYDIINEESFGAVEGITTYEPVPRFTKRPGDLVLQGSNNTLISLGQLRSGDPSEELKSKLRVTPVYQGFVDLEKDNAQPWSTANIAPTTLNSLSPEIGAIDLVVGRHHELATITNTRARRETLKTIDGSEAQKEGDPDYMNDDARIQLTMQLDVDKEYGIILQGGSAPRRS